MALQAPADRLDSHQAQALFGPSDNRSERYRLLGQQDQKPGRPFRPTFGFCQNLSPTTPRRYRKPGNPLSVKKKIQSELAENKALVFASRKHHFRRVQRLDVKHIHIVDAHRLQVEDLGQHSRIGRGFYDAKP